MSKLKQIRTGSVIKVPTQNSGASIGDNSIATSHVQDLAITEAKLANDVVNKWDIPTELVEASGVSNIAHASVGVWQDLVTVELTPGEWDMVGLVSAYNNGTTSQSGWSIAISENSANTTTDHTDGINELGDTVPITTSGFSYNQVIPMYRVTVITTKTYYLKFNKFFTSTNFQASNYRISARRVK